MTNQFLHALLSYLAVVFLLLATISKAVGIWSKKGYWNKIGTILLVFGVIAIWIAVSFGDDLTAGLSQEMLNSLSYKQHANLANTTAWIFSMAFILDLLMRFAESFRKRSSYIILVLLMAAGSLFLIAVAYFGIQLPK